MEDLYNQFLNLPMHSKIVVMALLGIAVAKVSGPILQFLASPWGVVALSVLFGTAWYFGFFGSLVVGIEAGGNAFMSKLP